MAIIRQSQKNQGPNFGLRLSSIPRQAHELIVWLVVMPQAPTMDHYLAAEAEEPFRSYVGRISTHRWVSHSITAQA
ncbi:hypothetical protein [Mesorhizobium sp.]|uniref:hypothetical protein n=1 Tax=Mesorhizobium sp. TaxID=1871066 RepID=UPI0025CF7EA2|nr:hypothetical protein [Mesorhizobium sp.]